MRKLLLPFIVIVLLVLVGANWWNAQLAAPGVSPEAKEVIIPKGTSLGDVTTKLAKMGLIRSPWAFRLYAKQKGLSSRIQAGTFKLSPSMSASQVLDALVNKPVEKWVTLLEGWRVEEMAEKISSEFRIQNSEFLRVAEEGYMFPDTYLFPNDVTEAQIIKAMKNDFDQRFSEDLQAKIRAQGLTVEEGVTLASIVEREARSDEVRRRVASILLKRLKIGMGLNADATIQYALGYQKAEKSWWKRHLTLEDLKIVSPYNTYLHAGLPPAPISNPGLSSLKAVANADPSTPYLYYYHDSKGNSYYAKTLEEHNQNVAKYP